MSFEEGHGLRSYPPAFQPEPCGSLPPTIMEFATIAALVLLVVSEVLPYTPLKGNGIIQEILEVLRGVFPYASKRED